MYERIKELAREKGLTIQQLEAVSGMSNGIINKWANSSPRSDYLYAVAQVLNTTMEYLLTGENKNPGAAAPGVSDSEMELIRLFRLVSPDDQRQILRQLSALEQLERGTDSF